MKVRRGGGEVEALALERLEQRGREHVRDSFGVVGVGRYDTGTITLNELSRLAVCFHPAVCALVQAHGLL